jgi:acetylornithine/N-succinyldiaminopimelate aminotransferase
MLKPGFFAWHAKMSPLLKQKLAPVVDRHPLVLAEVRRGLVDHVKAVSAEDLVTRCASSTCSRSAPAKTWWLLPPLIVTEAEIEEAVQASLSRLYGAFRFYKLKRAAGQ